ncbi:MAG: polymer-forming cytoskeletal protein [Bacillota bacterium]|nr:polymer-forming cytoskeletal protein [Bacillota bacterium]
MFGKKKEEVVVETPVKANATIIGDGVEFKGNFTTSDPIYIYGKLEGDVESTNQVFVAKSGVMCGNGVMQVLEVEGNVDGDLKCLEVAKIAESGKLSGSLATARLQTEDGSTFDGKLSMLKVKEKKETEVQPE